MSNTEDSKLLKRVKLVKLVSIFFGTVALLTVVPARLLKACINAVR